MSSPEIRNNASGPMLERFPFFRTQPVYYAGMPVALDRKWWYKLLPKKRRNYKDLPTYEAALICGLTKSAKAGSHIVVVGGGVGVTIAIAAKLVGSTGSVICYEGSSQCIDQASETLARNNLTGSVKLVFAIVGEDISVYKSTQPANILPADKLPPCDILELDCEGAEIKILTEISIRPKTILVETHGCHGATTQAVKELLAGLGYKVENLGVAEPYLADYCKEHDIFVLKADRS